MHSLPWITIFGSLVMRFANDFHSRLRHSWKLLANRLTRDPKIVFHGNSCIILYILFWFIHHRYFVTQGPCITSSSAALALSMCLCASLFSIRNDIKAACKMLSHCALVMPFGIINLCQHWCVGNRYYLNQYWGPVTIIEEKFHKKYPRHQQVSLKITFLNFH